MKDQNRLSTSDIADAGREPLRERDLAPPAAELPGEQQESPAPLFARESADGYRTRWSAIQTGFVDEPRKASKKPIRWWPR